MESEQPNRYVERVGFKLGVLEELGQDEQLVQIRLASNALVKIARAKKMPMDAAVSETSKILGISAHDAEYGVIYAMREGLVGFDAQGNVTVED